MSPALHRWTHGSTPQPGGKGQPQPSAAAPGPDPRSDQERLAGLLPKPGGAKRKRPKVTFELLAEGEAGIKVRRAAQRRAGS